MGYRLPPPNPPERYHRPAHWQTRRGGAELAAANEAIAAALGSPADWQVVTVNGEARATLDALRDATWMLQTVGEAGLTVIDLTGAL